MKRNSLVWFGCVERKEKENWMELDHVYEGGGCKPKVKNDLEVRIKWPSKIGWIGLDGLGLARWIGLARSLDVMLKERRLWGYVLTQVCLELLLDSYQNKWQQMVCVCMLLTNLFCFKFSIFNLSEYQMCNFSYGYIRKCMDEDGEIWN